MPIYEYRCRNCRRKTSVRVSGFSEPSGLMCSFCGSSQLSRLISRVGIVRSEESRLEDMADPANWGGLDENDPRSMARWMKKMGEATGEDLGPEFDEAVSQMEAGEMPDGLDAPGDSDVPDETA